MTITTSKGKTFDVNWIWGPLRGTNQVMIDLEDARKISEIAQDFEGCASIEKTDIKRDGVKEIYDGYTELVSVVRERATGTVRVTLEKPKEAA